MTTPAKDYYKCTSQTCSDNGGTCCLSIPYGYEAPTSCVNPESFDDECPCDCKWVRGEPHTAIPPHISNIEFAKGLAECLGNEPEEHEECYICPLLGKCIDLHLGNQHGITIDAQVLEGVLDELTNQATSCRYLEAIHEDAPSDFSPEIV